MSSAMQEIIGAVNAPVGQPYGQAGAPVVTQVVPLQVQRKMHQDYPTYESLAAEVASTLDRLHGEGTAHPIPEILRRIYKNAAGMWVRVDAQHSGESYQDKQPDGSVVEYNERIYVERAVALDLDTARAASQPEMDYFWAGKGWVRRGVKREWEDEQNLGTNARQVGSWEQQRAGTTHPFVRPQQAQAVNALPAQVAAATQMTPQTTLSDADLEPPPPPAAPAKGSRQKE